MNYLQAVEEYQNNAIKLRGAVKKFLEIINRKDTSDSDKEFSPVTINCCRALWMEELSEVLKDMERYSGYKK
jgi:hypothetical protein